MNILFPNSILNKHVYALHVARAHELSREESGLTIICCNGFLKACEVNVVGNKFRCMLCKRRVNSLVKNTEAHTIDLEELSALKKSTKHISEDKDSNNDFTGSEVIDALKMAAAGTIASYERVSDINRLSEFGRKRYSVLGEESIRLYQAAINLWCFVDAGISETNAKINKQNIKISVFNGRYVTALPFLFVAKKINNIDFYAMELWGQRNPIISKNRLIHDPTYIYDSCFKSYSRLSQDESKLLAEKYYNSRWTQKGNCNGEKTFTNKQKKSVNNIFRKDSTIKISVFPSSGYEYNFLPYGYDQVIQDDELGCFIDGLSNSKRSIEIIVRLHPNLSNATVLEYEAFKKLSEKTSSNLLVTVVDPTSTMSTYQLMRESDYVVSFASFSAVEANYLGKKVLQVGPSRYRYFNISNQYKNGHEAAEAILQNKVVNKNKLGSIVFACGFMSRTDFMSSYHFDGKTLTSGSMVIKIPLFEKVILAISSYRSFVYSFIKYRSSLSSRL